MGASKMVIDLTLSAYRAEPPLGPSLPSVHSLSLGELDLSRGSWAILLRRRRLRVLSIVLVLRSRGGLRFGVSNGTSSTELNHVDGTLATRNQMAAGQENDLTRRGKTDETFGCRFVFRWRLRNGRIGMSGISGRLGRLSALRG